MITRLIREGSNAAFEDAVKAFIPTSLAFPGHMGVHMLRPPPGENVYGAVLTFRAKEDWTAFQRSPQYLTFLAAIEPLLAEPQGIDALCGLESWFTPIGARITRVPPRWKMALVTWVGVCLTVLTVNAVLSPWTPAWPVWLYFLLSNGLIVIGLTWAVMPALNRLFGSWLLSAAQGLSPTVALSDR
jgi:hypothetical protein